MDGPLSAVGTAIQANGMSNKEPAVGKPKRSGLRKCNCFTHPRLIFDYQIPGFGVISVIGICWDIKVKSFRDMYSFFYVGIEKQTKTNADLWRLKFDFKKTLAHCVFQRSTYVQDVLLFVTYEGVHTNKHKGEQDFQIWMPDIWHFLGFSDFFLWSPPWNNENKSCLNDIKFWEVSWNPKISRFWKLQLSMSSGTQKVSNARHPYLRILFPFWI